MAAKKKKKKATETKRKAPNPLTMKVTVKLFLRIEQGAVYSVTIKGDKGEATLGHLTAKNETEAKRKAKRLMRALL